MIFEFIYKVTVISLMPLFLLSSLKRFEKLSSQILIPFMIMLYLIGMYRETGIDIGNYIRNYNNITNQDIYDPIYLLITFITYKLGVSFKFFLLFIGISNIYMLYKIAKYFEIRYGIILFIFMLHLFVVRDFVQFRIGWACLIILYGYTFKGPIKYCFYVLGTGIHLTSLYLIYVLLGSQCNSFEEKLINKKFSFYILISLFVSLNIVALSFIDPRIELYISWKEEFYGNKVSTFYQPFFIIFILFFAYRLIEASQQRIFLTRSFLLALATFFFFSHYAMFAHRLTNIAFTLYPIAVAIAIKNNNRGFEKLLFLIILSLILFTREGTSLIISKIGL